MKVYRRVILILFILMMPLILFTACSPERDDNYIEVTGIRVPKSTVYLSPDGATSSYQLEPIIVPNNATNRKLIYYVSPKDLEYFSIDENGLIKSKKITEEGRSIQVRVYSSTNEKAFALVSVIIENASVKEIVFPERGIKVQENSEPFQLQPIFKPAHAQDGREVTYTSLNPEVLVVDAQTGMVTTKKVGIATVIARSNITLGDAVIDGRVTITVAYVAGTYTLGVTNPSPQFDQVVGDPQKLSFSISRDLYDNIDLEPDIKWYVAGNRILSQNGRWDFEYMPEKNSSPSPPYTVKAIITPKHEDPIIFESPPITLYKLFSGFNLRVNEPEGMKYYYDEMITLDPNMESELFDWYMKAQGESGFGKYIGTSLYSNNKGNFKFVGNEVGTFVVTAQAKQNNLIRETKQFELSIIKYVIEDRIQVIPQTNLEEKIPDSYDWYVHSYDQNAANFADGIMSSILVGTTKGNSPFNYQLTANGWYVLSSTPTVNGLHIYTEVDGVSTILREYTEPFQVWDKDSNTDIEYILIDGAKVNNEYRPVIKWNPTAGVNSYIIELLSDDQIYIIDTTQANKDNSGIVYRDYSIILPLTIATFKEDFSVRIKSRGGIFSEELIYEADTITEKNYKYFEELNYGINSYVQDMKELEEILNYITVFKPKKIIAATSNGYTDYNITISTKLLYKNVNKEAYPVFYDSPYGEEEEILTNIYYLVYGAINSCFIKGIDKLDFSYDEIEDSYGIIITIADSEEYIYQQGIGINNFDFSVNYASESRQQNYEDFSIQAKDEIEVSTSNQLYFAVSNGKKPLPVIGSIAEQIYQDAKSVLNRILNYGMSPYQKVLAINDFLASEVENDKMLKEYSLLDPTPHNLYGYDGYHLDGVFVNRKAVSLGKSKAFNLLCWIEGIPSYLINGTKGGIKHSWNKVYLGDKWYNIDVTIARAQRDQGAVLSYAFFLVSDSSMTKSGYVFFGQSFEAQEDYNNKGLINGSITVSSIEELRSGLPTQISQIGTDVYSFGICFVDGFGDNQNLRDIIVTELQQSLEGGEVSFEELVRSSDNYYILLLK